MVLSRPYRIKVSPSALPLLRYFCRHPASMNYQARYLTAWLIMGMSQTPITCDPQAVALTCVVPDTDGCRWHPLRLTRLCLPFRALVAASLACSCSRCSRTWRILALCSISSATDRSRPISCRQLIEVDSFQHRNTGGMNLAA